jgi:hypothetical protein
MISVVLKNLSTGYEITLDARRQEVLRREMRRTAGSWLMRLIWLLFPWLWRRRMAGLLELTAADAEIRIDNNGNVRVYHLYARSILVDEATGRPRQFYMGLLVLEWLVP